MSRKRLLLTGLVGVFLVLLCIWGLTDVRDRASLDPGQLGRHRTDVTVYTAAGDAIRKGQNPYEATSPRGWHYLYPPLFAILMAPLADLDPQWQGVIWFFLSLLMGIGCIVEYRILLRAIGTPNDRILVWIWACGLVAALFPALNTLQRGQIGIAVGYPLLVGFRLLVTSRGPRGWIGGGILLALPVAFKVTPALPVVVLGWWEVVRTFRAPRSAGATVGGARRVARLGWATTGVVAGLLLFFIVVPAAVTGWSANNRHLRQWVDEIGAGQDLRASKSFNPYSARNQSLENAMRRFRMLVAHRVAGAPPDTALDAPQEFRVAIDPDPAAARLLLTALRVGGVALLLWAVWRLAPSGDPGVHAAIFGLACTLSLLVSPISWGHHYVLFVPAVFFVPLRVEVAGRPRAARVFAASAAALLLLHYAMVAVVGRAGLLGIGVTLWYFAAVGAILGARDEPRAN